MDNYGTIRTNWFEGFTALILIHPSGEVEGRAEDESLAILYKGICTVHFLKTFLQAKTA